MKVITRRMRFGRQREINALFVATAFIAAVRTAHYDVERTSWQLVDTIGESMLLARIVLKAIELETYRYLG